MSKKARQLRKHFGHLSGLAPTPAASPAGQPMLQPEASPNCYRRRDLARQGRLESARRPDETTAREARGEAR